jgi:hypothetical protein
MAASKVGLFLQKLTLPLGLGLQLGVRLQVLLRKAHVSHAGRSVRGTRLDITAEHGQIGTVPRSVLKSIGQSSVQGRGIQIVEYAQGSFPVPFLLSPLLKDPLVQAHRAFLSGSATATP